MSDADLEEILNESIQALEAHYKEDEETRSYHLADRFVECYKKYSNAASEEFVGKKGEGPVPVLIGKHFTWAFIQKAAHYKIKAIHYTNMVIANNPQKPGDLFLAEWGNFLQSMEKELDSIATKLSGETGPNDYVVWCHQQMERRQPLGEIHCSIYGPEEIIKAGRKYKELLELTQLRIAQIQKDYPLP